MDKLEEIVEKQKELTERIMEERNIEFESTNEMLEKHVLALNDEVAELQRELDWKWWTNEQNIDIKAIKEELIDILHFNLQALILLGCSAEEIYRMYVGKNETNHDRQDGKTDRKGYDVNSNENYENVEEE